MKQLDPKYLQPTRVSNSSIPTFENCPLKQAIINYDNTRVHGRFLATVHDEICISVPKEHLATEVKLLTDAMEAGEFDIPMEDYR